MKNVIRTIAVIFLLTLAFQSSAQVKFGLKAGLNLSNMVDKDKDEIYSKDFKSNPGYHFGVTAEYALDDKLSIEPALLFSKKGYKMSESYSGVDSKTLVNLNYLEIPINGIYKIDLGETKLKIHAGPYLGFALSGKMKTTVTGEPDETTTIKIGSGTNKDIKGLDFGLNVGAGLEFGVIEFGLQYGIGLANLTNSTVASAVQKNKVFSVSVGYKFGGK